MEPYDFGFRCVIAPSFADIFYNNSLKNGLLPIALNDDLVAELANRNERPDYKLTIDLNDQIVTDNAGFAASFEIDGFRKHCLINGLDDIGLTLKHKDKITEYEAKRGIAARFS